VNSEDDILKNGELNYLAKVVRNFCEARDWDSFHGLKDLAIGLVTESSELLELTRFKNEEELQKLLEDESYREKLSDELADVFYFVLRLADKNNLDLKKALLNKMQKNNLKYPIEKSRGSNKKYDEFT
jgi:NTP pyrophosphatase (non-canonical NTP hydrolase)